MEVDLEFQDNVQGQMESLDDLEKKYFGDKLSYYSNKADNTNFNNFELSESDLKDLQNSIGEDIIVDEGTSEENLMPMQDTTVTLEQGRVEDTEPGLVLGTPDIRSRVDWKEVRPKIVQRTLPVSSVLNILFSLVSIILGYSLVFGFSMMLWQTYLARVFILQPLSEITKQKNRITYFSLFLLALPAFIGASSCLITGYYCKPGEEDTVKLFYNGVVFWITVLQIFGIYYLDRAAVLTD